MANDVKALPEQRVSDASSYASAFTVESRVVPLDVALSALAELRAEVERLKGENANLKTVMVAAAEEIHQHWDAHCDAEGYGPANLMRRLEEGIPSQYGYTAGAFAELRQRADTAEARLERAMAALEAAREDAERWRALREMDGGEIYALFGDCDGMHPEQADAAIDRARGKGVKA